MKTPLYLGALVALAAVAAAQPRAVPGAVEFAFVQPGAGRVSLVGDFNGWSKEENPMSRGADGVWTTRRGLAPGIFQYLFLVDGTQYLTDPANPASIENYNRSSRNSVFVLTDQGEVVMTSTRPAAANPGDDYAGDPNRKAVYLNIIWHQHQPLYVDPARDQLQGPWVRTHATKDYYDMAAMLRQYPDIHCTINLTSSLLHQLRSYYVDRIMPFVDPVTNRVDREGLWKAWKGKTDPWIDLALTPARDYTEEQRGLLTRNTWNCFGISEVMIDRFPEYAALKARLGKEGRNVAFTEQEERSIAFWFYLAHFDPDFFAGPVTLPGGMVCDLSDLVVRRPDGTWWLRHPVTDDDCNRIVAEAVKVAAGVIPVHRSLLRRPGNASGQIDVITTPFYHPILPLIYDSDLAKTGQPGDALPSRFSYPDDARAQVRKAVTMYREIFGIAPLGMWPGEGSVAQPVLGILRDEGILWTASDVKVLTRSRPADRPNTTPYRFPAPSGEGENVSMALVFRDTELSDRIGFKYQTYEGEEAAEDFVRSILRSAPGLNQPDVMITVILDGENAWEWYRRDPDGKAFLHALYRKLSRLYENRQIITTTTAEYLEGNPARGIPAHPIEALPAMSWLWPGSWINASYDTWIGEAEENTAWEYLGRARRDLASSGLARPDPDSPPPAPGSPDWYRYMAWEAMYAAEGSDWFWWYGADQSAPAGDAPFDIAFRTHLDNVYRFGAQAGAALRSPGFDPIIVEGKRDDTGQGVMARSSGDVRQVLFVCDAHNEKVAGGIFIVGNLPPLGEWNPNTVRMYDDGTHGDASPRDGRWSLLLTLPVGEEVQYKYTNSGTPGTWVPGEEFAQRNRSFVVPAGGDQPHTIIDVFGK